MARNVFDCFVTPRRRAPELRWPSSAPVGVSARAFLPSAASTTLGKWPANAATVMPSQCNLDGIASRNAPGHRLVVPSPRQITRTAPTHSTAARGGNSTAAAVGVVLEPDHSASGTREPLLQPGVFVDRSWAADW